MIGKNIKISKGFKNFLTQILHKEEKPVEEKKETKSKGKK